MTASWWADSYDNASEEVDDVDCDGREELLKAAFVLTVAP